MAINVTFKAIKTEFMYFGTQSKAKHSKAKNTPSSLGPPPPPP